MRANHLFLTRISKLRRLMIKEWIKRLLVATFLLSSILSTVAFGVQKIGLFHWEGYSIYPLLVLLSFVLSMLYALRGKRSFLDELIEIDLRLGLKERLSTAYEYHQRGRKSVFVDLLIEDASNLLGSIKANQIFPRYFSPAHLSIPLFTAVIIILLSIGLSPTAPIQTRAAREKLKEVGVKMEAYSKRELQDIKKREEKSRKDLFRQMENIAKELKGQSIRKKRLLESLGKLMKEAEAERTQVARRLEAELGLGDISHTPTLKPLRKKNITPNELKQLREQLEDLFEGEAPVSILRDISSLDQNRRLELFLDETMNEVRSALAGADESYDLGEEEGVLLGKASKKGNNNNKDTSPGQALAPVQSGEADSERLISPAPGRPKAGSKKSDKRSPAPGEDLFFAAGREKAEGRKKPPYDLETSKGPAVKDKGISGQGDRHNVYVRSLPIMGKATVKEEDVIRPYRQELEGVLQKEDIPLRYREYIKNYFLSIGLKKEEDGNGHNN